MNSRRAGFTLLEVLVTLSILSMALIVVFQLLSANMKNISASEDYVSAITMAEARMKELQVNENLSEGIWSEVTPEGYKIDISVREALKERTQNLYLKLLELDLAIHWAETNKRRSLTLRTMKIVKKQI